MKRLNLSLLVGMISMLFITSCDNNDPVIPNEEELITTLKFTLAPDGGGTPVVLTFQDLDGDGGNPPAITRGTVGTNTTYKGSLKLLNELETPAEDITVEVQGEAEEHQFFYQTSVSGLNIAYDDLDANGKPLGLSTVIKTTGATSGTIKIILRHEPNKDAVGVSTGDITNAGGETDLEVTFNVDIQ